MNRIGKLAFFFVLITNLGEKGAFSNDQDSSLLILYEYNEALFDIPFPLDSLYARSEFSFISGSKKTTCIFFDTGPFQCYFYCEPGKSYYVQLPEPFLIDERWKDNPYHQAIPVHVPAFTEPGKEQEDPLNQAIRKFDEQYDPFLAQLTQLYYTPELARARLDSFLTKNYNQDQTSDTSYFGFYKYYKKGILEFHLKQHNLSSLIDEYLLHKPVRAGIPPYRNLFSLLTENYFSQLQAEDGFEKIFAMMSSASMDDIKDMLRKDPLLSNDTILETVLLKECYSACYQGSIPLNRILELTDSLGEESKLEETKIISSWLRRKLSFLKIGYSVPSFSAKDLNGNGIQAGLPSDKIVLLGFCDLDRLQCLREMEHLKYLQGKHERFLQSIVILKYSSQKQLDDFLKNTPSSIHIVEWNENPEPANLYEIKGLPSFFLIDRDGSMLRNPAPLPSENFEYELFLILRAKGEV